MVVLPVEQHYSTIVLVWSIVILTIAHCTNRFGTAALCHVDNYHTNHNGGTVILYNVLHNQCLHCSCTVTGKIYMGREGSKSRYSYNILLFIVLVLCV